MTIELKEDFTDGVVRHGRDNISSQYPKEARDMVAVGDLNSNAKGSGARKNAGKPQLDLIPVGLWNHIWKFNPNMTCEISQLLHDLQRWQEGDTRAIKDILSHDDKYILEAVSVLEFGARKYKAWNWVKGMRWSICVGCILRHVQKILYGEELDPESGISHWGHIKCNVMFLAYYADHYPEGDDRPPQFVSCSE